MKMRTRILLGATVIVLLFTTVVLAQVSITPATTSSRNTPTVYAAPTPSAPTLAPVTYMVTPQPVTNTAVPVYATRPARR